MTNDGLVLFISPMSFSVPCSFSRQEVYGVVKVQAIDKDPEKQLEIFQTLVLLFEVYFLVHMSISHPHLKPVYSAYCAALHYKPAGLLLYKKFNKPAF